MQELFDQRSFNTTWNGVFFGLYLLKVSSTGTQPPTGLLKQTTNRMHRLCAAVPKVLTLKLYQFGFGLW